MAFVIKENVRLHSSVCRLAIEAPDIARKAQPGQFVMVRSDEQAERIPLTVFRANPHAGTIELVVQEAGESTRRICAMPAGAEILDVLGPLGEATEIKQYGTVVCVGGGVGIAEIYPVAAALRQAGNRVISIIGARSLPLLILEAEMRQASDELLIATDDGSAGRKGFVTDILGELIGWQPPDIVFAVGPLPMMARVAEATRPAGIKTIVSLNAIMVDGTGMCGSCRVSVGGKVKFVCVDGPDFDAHQVDFKELSQRQKRFDLPCKLYCRHH
ncbi:MAG: sulfide/dihydroorotate dehydrogenase-like FAD/NAD-binding protein [Candidatus Omnitrophica bacterium]|nr:sulfide/dihydroorotate dehydrogenase-like FAD/NAD-binding protein [Candidatus Omnitrophota bacterium]